MENNKIICIVRGGVLSAVYSSRGDSEVVLIDFDDADSDPSREESAEDEMETRTRGLHRVF